MHFYFINIWITNYLQHFCDHHLLKKKKMKMMKLCRYLVSHCFSTMMTISQVYKNEREELSCYSACQCSYNKSLQDRIQSTLIISLGPHMYFFHFSVFLLIPFIYWLNLWLKCFFSSPSRNCFIDLLSKLEYRFLPCFNFVIQVIDRDKASSQS